MHRAVFIALAFGIGAVVVAAASANTGTQGVETHAVNPDSLAAARDSAMQSVLRAIAGRERMPAESVFANIRTLRGVPAGRVPRMMNLGFGRGLGVGCDHCHVLSDWASDEKPQKEIARQMLAMTDTINRRLLPAIANLQSAQPVVNCTTCHRGAVKPATDLPGR